MGEVRSSAPVHAREFAVPPDQLAHCAQLQSEAHARNALFRSTTHPITRIITVESTVNTPFSGQDAATSVTFTPTDTGTVVEARRGEYNGRWVLYETWPLIEQCAQQLTAGSTPPPAASTARHPIVPAPR